LHPLQLAFGRLDFLVCEKSFSALTSWKLSKELENSVIAWNEQFKMTMIEDGNKATYDNKELNTKAKELIQ